VAVVAAAVVAVVVVAAAAAEEEAVDKTARTKAMAPSTLVSVWRPDSRDKVRADSSFPELRRNLVSLARARWAVQELITSRL